MRKSLVKVDDRLKVLLYKQETIMLRNFDQVYIFGDSLSDTGNLSTFSGGQLPPPPPLYAPGRLSNGDVWVDYLTDDLGLDLNPFSTGFDADDSVNFSIGGALSNDSNEVPGVPGLEQQVDAFESFAGNPSPGQALDDDLFFLWIGANDYFSFIQDNPATPNVIETNFPKSGRETINTILEVVDINIKGAVRDIIDAGGENIVLFNLPDLDRTPLGQSLDKAGQRKLRKLTEKHNRRLDKLAAKTEAAYPDVNVIEIDTNQLFDDLTENPREFGLTNVTDNFTGIDLYTGINQPPASGDPDRYLFWDSVHPTTTVHNIVADFVTDELVNEGLIV
jgi:phospholipase/lecithinase/hemolysin